MKAENRDCERERTNSVLNGEAFSPLDEGSRRNRGLPHWKRKGEAELSLPSGRRPKTFVF